VEVDANLPAGKVHIITNVTTPTLTIFRPAPEASAGTALVVVPGGAFRALAWDLDGLEVAKWLTSRGVTAFLLKYRVRPPAQGTAPIAESFGDFLRRTTPARQIALADAQQSLRVIRANAKHWSIAPDRVGMIGFSAGAITTVSAALAADGSSRPNFAIAAYGAMPDTQIVPSGAPPIFIVAAQDDPEAPSAKSIEIFDQWNSASRPAELHLYEKGGHGFGMRSRNLPVDQWTTALGSWLTSRGLAKAAVTRRTK
jgi:acetyl esterase/lipase